MCMRNYFSREVRRLILLYLENGMDPELIPEFIADEIPEDFPRDFGLLPQEAKDEIRLLDAKRYLKGYPDATREEIAQVREWVLEGNRPEWPPYPAYDDRGCLVDFLASIRFFDDLDFHEEAASHEMTPDTDDLPF